jgi:hypothetical protein
VRNLGFWATIAVSWQGVATLISQPPSDADWLIEGSFPDDDGWLGLPKDAGIYNCRFHVRWRFGEPEITTMEIKNMTDEMAKNIGAAGDKIYLLPSGE